MTTPFVPDTLLPGQLDSDLPGGRAQQGERLLLLAVLQDAVDTYRRCRGSRDPEARLLFDETRAWVESRDHDTVFSFDGCGESNVSGPVQLGSPGKVPIAVAFDSDINLLVQTR